MRLGYSTKPAGAVPPAREALALGAEAGQQFPMGLNPGEILDDRFLLTEMISQGGMATIFKARDLKDHDQDVAVKVPHLGIESNPSSFARFQREEEIGCRLNHPFILKFIPVNGTKSRPYIVTEYLRGCTLAHLLGRMRPLPERDALKFASLVCEALQYLHDHGVVHRDLKPSNLMICSEGRLRIMDFGISQSVESRRLTFVGFTAAMGTPDYIAPEQIKGRRGDRRSDIYSLGAVLYEMLTGAPPFEGDDPFVIMNTRMSGDPVAPRKLRPEISPQAEEIVLRALRREPAERYQTAAEMKADLDAPDAMHLTGLSERLQASTPWKRARLLGRHLFFIVLLPIAIQVILFLLIWHHHGNKR